MSWDRARLAQRHRWSTSLHNRLDVIMNAGIDQGVFPGGVVLVRYRDEVVVHEAYGHSHIYRDTHTLLPEPLGTRRDTVYDLASITKAFTATCAMQLVDEGTLRLDDLVRTYLSRFGGGSDSDVTIRHVLSHVSGLPRLRLWKEASTYEARIERLLALIPKLPPGSRLEYSDTNYLLLGELVQTIDERPLDQVITSRVLDPLALLQTSFGPVNVRTASVAATEDESSIGRGMVHGEVHDENAWSLDGVAGHAGLFGTAEDLSAFGQTYINGGKQTGVRFLKPETIAEMTRDQLGDTDSRGLGWQLNASYYMGGLASPQTYGHTGFTGTSIVIDPRRELVVLLLTNRVHPTRNGPEVDPVRRAVADAVLDAVDGI